MSDTSPSKMARIHEIAGEDRYRREMLTNVTILLERSAYQAQWMKDHDDKDNARFARLEQSLGGVTSNVGSLETDRAKIVGVRDAFYTLCKFAAVAVAAGWAIFITFFKTP